MACRVCHASLHVQSTADVFAPLHNLDCILAFYNTRGFSSQASAPRPQARRLSINETLSPNLAPEKKKKKKNGAVKLGIAFAPCLFASYPLLQAQLDPWATARNNKKETNVAEERNVTLVNKNHKSCPRKSEILGNFQIRQTKDQKPYL